MSAIHKPELPLHTDFVGDERVFWACVPLLFKDDKGKILIPANFLSDGLSIPKMFQNIFSKSPSYIFAGILHDFCYKKNTGLDLSRRQADKIFLRWMKHYQVGLMTRQTIWLAVRVGARKSWKVREPSYYKGEHP